MYIQLLALPALPLPFCTVVIASTVVICHCQYSCYFALQLLSHRSAQASQKPAMSSPTAPPLHTPRTLPSLCHPPSGASVSARPPQLRSQVHSYRLALPSPQPANQGHLSPIRHRQFAQSLPLPQTEFTLLEPLQQPTILSVLPISPLAHSERLVRRGLRGVKARLLRAVQAGPLAPAHSPADNISLPSPLGPSGLAATERSTAAAVTLIAPTAFEPTTTAPTVQQPPIPDKIKQRILQGGTLNLIHCCLSHCTPHGTGRAPPLHLPLASIMTRPWTTATLSSPNRSTW